MVDSVMLKSLPVLICSRELETSSALYKYSASNFGVECRNLILSPIIQNGRIDEAREMAQVRGLHDSITSYSGYLTVNAEFNSNMLFWFFPAQIDPASAPLILYLNGGPGLSSLMSLFVENGPFLVDKEGNLHERDHTWTKSSSVLYIDNPVGAGLSYTDKEEGYARSQQDVARDLYSALLQFFQMFPEFRRNDFYIAGESYGGKYAPSLGEKIHMENQNTDMGLNLKGLIIGNGYTDPVSVLCQSEMYFQLGLLNQKIFEKAYRLEEKLRDAINSKKWTLATQIFFRRMRVLNAGTGYRYEYNFLQTKQPAEFEYHTPFLQQKSILERIHAEDSTYSSFVGQVRHHLRYDIYKSEKPAVELLLRKGYRILYYHGLLDFNVPYAGQTKFLNSLNWSGSGEFQDARRRLWMVDGDIAGYVQDGGNLTFAGIRKAGHMVPYDQPELAESLIRKYVSEESIVS